MRVFCASKFEQGKGEERLLPPRCCDHRPLFDFIKRTEEKSTAEKQFYKRRDNATGDGMVTKISFSRSISLPSIFRRYLSIFRRGNAEQSAEQRAHRHDRLADLLGVGEAPNTGERNIRRSERRETDESYPLENVVGFVVQFHGLYSFQIKKSLFRMWSL